MAKTVKKLETQLNKKIDKLEEANEKLSHMQILINDGLIAHIKCIHTMLNVHRKLLDKHDGTIGNMALDLYDQETPSGLGLDTTGSGPRFKI